MLRNSTQWHLQTQVYLTWRVATGDVRIYITNSQSANFNSVPVKEVFLAGKATAGLVNSNLRLLSNLG